MQAGTLASFKVQARKKDQGLRISGGDYFNLNLTQACNAAEVSERCHSLLGSARAFGNGGVRVVDMDPSFTDTYVEEDQGSPSALTNEEVAAAASAVGSTYPAGTHFRL